MRSLSNSTQKNNNTLGGWLLKSQKYALTTQNPPAKTQVLTGKRDRLSRAHQLLLFTSVCHKMEAH